MSELNKSYRIRTRVGRDVVDDFLTIDESLMQEYDTFEVLSVNIKSTDAYRLHNSSTGIIVGRVLANNGFGIPNAKISIFVRVDNEETADIGYLYPYTSTISRDHDGVRYNLLPNEQVNGCHQVVGTFPTKRYALDNDVILEIFDKYYKFTTKTNNSGDYLICGVPVGAHTLHMDLDLSDCGILSQKPRDFVYKGYTVEQFESPTKFKGGTDYASLSQVITQDQVVNVKPFWGNESLGESIGITRADIDVNFKFEPTCVFMGSIFSDNASNGYSKKCIPTDSMGNMDELVTGEGTIEMIRKTPGGNIEEMQIKGNKLINGDGVWCYQIPMNLDYMVTDEYGNMVPTDNPEIGIPTRASVRFRISMDDHEENTDNFFRAKVLVPHNPQNKTNGGHEDYDYEFGTYTRDESFRDLFWNNVYSVKSYIPRTQKTKNPKRVKFSGIKGCQNFGPNNPMPYNNIRIKMPLIFTIVCAIIKAFIFMTKLINTVIAIIGYIMAVIGTIHFLKIRKHEEKRWANIRAWEILWAPIFLGVYQKAITLHMIVLKDGLCPDLENWYFSPYYNFVSGITTYEKAGRIIVLKECKANQCPPPLTCYDLGSNNDEPEVQNLMEGDQNDGEGDGNNGTVNCNFKPYNILQQTLERAISDGDKDDPKSIDDINYDEDDSGACITKNTDYLLACVEMNLAQEYKVINFDFYNDWVNGTIYNPRWVRYIKPKLRFLWITWRKTPKVKGCMDDTSIFSTSRRYYQQCAITYDEEMVNSYKLISSVEKPPLNNSIEIARSNNLHKKRGVKHQKIFGKNGGICHQSTTMKGQYVYYLKPCEWLENTNRKVNLYATDIILLGSFNDCDLNGIPQTFTHLTSSTYTMPTNLALTNMDTNGPLYATDEGTICIGTKTSSSATVINARVRQIDGSGLTFEDEIKFYSGATNYSLDEREEYPNGISIDTIAMTEAAGIAWNYTGPGQGRIEEENMYYPGGHFLGITCVNSQTNLKSCINLSRICEIGSTMSQRREDVRLVESGGTLKYVYTVPSGFIAGDEIVDTDFRSMFATMNKKRLIATKRNRETGYKFYDFDFSMPTNFNGSFSKLVTNGYLDPYNTKIDTREENLFSLANIIRGKFRADYDQDEPSNTQTRTRETTNLDYYLFRFGITYDQLTGDNGQGFLQMNKFLRHKKDSVSDTGYSLPQYENSYYFYFGLKYGATALDEFNKQFYSECDNLMLKKAPNMFLTGDIDFCEGKGKINVITEGLSTPYQSITIYKDGSNTPFYIIDGRYPSHRPCLTYESFNLLTDYGHGPNEYFDFGKYKVTLIDADDIEITKEITLGLDMITYDLNVVDFNLPVPETGTSVPGSIYRGGYVSVSNIVVEGLDANEIEFKFEISDMVSYDYSTPYYPGEISYLYGNKVGVNYVLTLSYRCVGNVWHTFEILNFLLYDNSSVQLKIGDSNYSENCIYDFDLVDNIPTMNMMNRTWWWDESNGDIGNNSGTNPERKKQWFYRVLLYNRNRARRTFNSNVFAENGRKVLWGSPQRMDGISQQTACTENILSIPAGYSLDDTHSYYCTYGLNVCNLQPTPGEWDEQQALRSGNDDLYSNCVMHYCAQAYNGYKVCGVYKGTMRKEDDNVVLNFDTHYFHDGYGCVFKPVPYGDLKFMIYNSSDDYEGMMSELSEYENGIFYPTFIYPVVKRPFWADMKYFLWTEKGIINSLNEGEFVNTYKFGYHYENKINNGITFNKKLNPDSYMTGIGSLSALTFNEKDSYGITEDANTNRIVCFSGHTRAVIEPQMDAIEYSIKEGVGFEEASGFTLEHDFNYNLNFANNLAYILDESGRVESFVNIGGSSSGYSYYLGKIDALKDDIRFVINGEPSENYWLEYLSGYGYYAGICKFVDNGIASPIDPCNFGQEVNVDFKVVNDEVEITFNYIDFYGHEQRFIGDYNIEDNFGDASSCGGDRECILKRVVMPNISNVLPLRPVILGIVLEHPTIHGVEKTWSEMFSSQTFLRHLHNASYYNPERNRMYLPSEVGSEKLFGFGVTKVHTEDNDDLSVIKIYTDPISLPIGYDPFASHADIWANISPRDLEYMYQQGCGIGEKVLEYTVSASSYTTLTFVMENDEWFYLTPRGGDASLGNVFTMEFNGVPLKFDLHIARNESNEREGAFTVESRTDQLDYRVLQIGYEDAPEIIVKIDCHGYSDEAAHDCYESHEEQILQYSIAISLDSHSEQFPQGGEIGIKLYGSGRFHTRINNVNTYYLTFANSQFEDNPNAQPPIIPRPIMFSGRPIYLSSNINCAYIDENQHIYAGNTQYIIPEHCASVMGDYKVTFNITETC